MDKEDKSKSIYYRKSVLANETKKSIPIIIVIAVLALGILSICLVNSKVSREDSRGTGNPYICAECKALGFACKEHKNSDIAELVKEKTERYVYNFKVNGTAEESKHWMHKEKQFNSDCDFCNALQSECYGCKYDREAIDNKLNAISSDAIFKSKLCNADWTLGYANCSNCRAMLIKEIDTD